MKQSIYRLIIAGVVTLFFIATMAQAETRYVTDQMQITFRTGPGTDRKILSLLRSGQAVAVLQPEGDWAKVRLQNGKEGWVLQRYLSGEVPCRIRIKDIGQALEELKTEQAALQKTHQQLEADKAKLVTDLKKNRQELAKTKQVYEKLKKDAVGFLKLKDRHDKTIKRLSAQTEKANALDQDLTSTLKKQNIRWFLAGAGVLLFGFIMGFSTKKQKRHSSLL